MAKIELSVKHLQISRKNATILMVLCVTVSLTLTSLVFCRTLLAQRSYQAKVISKRTAAKEQLTANKAAVDSLMDSYAAFVEPQNNLIGGTATGTGGKDGDNGKIILDALPSKYDFPALATSIERLVADHGTALLELSGMDDEVNQQQTGSSSSTEPVEMPFNLKISGGYTSVQGLVSVFEKSIRPISVTTMDIEASEGGQLTLNLQAKTYYQPKSTLKIVTQEVKR